MLVALVGVLTSSLLYVLPDPVSITLVRWQPVATFGGDIALYADKLSLLFVILVTLLALAAAMSDWRTLRANNPDIVTAALLLTGAATAFLLAGNLLTLTFTWLLLDMGTIAALRWLYEPASNPVRVQAFALNYVGGLLVFLAAVASQSQSAGLAGQPWTPGTLGGVPAALLTLAAFVRLGAYPFHRNVPDAGATPLAAWLRLTPLVAGAYLLVRVAFLVGAAPISGPLWTLATGASSLAAALLAWLSLTRRDTLRWLAVYAASTTLLNLAPGQGEVAPLELLGGVGLVLAVGVLFLSESLDDAPLPLGGRRWVQAARGLAILNLWGLPLTLGFVYRWGVYRAELEADALSLLVWSAVAAAFAAAPLWALGRDLLRAPRLAATGDAVPWPELVGLSLLALPLLVIGLQPLLLSPALDAAAGGDAARYLSGIVQGTPTGLGVRIAAALLVPWLAGLGLARLRTRITAAAPLANELRRWLALDWLDTRRWRPVTFGTRILRGISDLGEAERYVGLLVVFVLIAALALLSQQ